MKRKRTQIEDGMILIVSSYLLVHRRWFEEIDDEKNVLE